MKKIFIILLALFAATSCTTEFSDSPEKASYQSREDYKLVNPEGDDLFCRVYRFMYSNHSYIEFLLNRAGCEPHAGVVHDPDCPCHGRAISPTTIPSSDTPSSDYESIFGSW